MQIILELKSKSKKGRKRNYFNQLKKTALQRNDT